METKSRTSPEQFLALLEFMESNGDIARPQPGPMGRIKADRLWSYIEGLLNGIGGGDIKPVSKCKKVWVDWKAKIKKKALQMRREASATDGGPNRRHILTNIEQRVLAVMGLNAVWGQVGIEERGFDDLPPTTSPLPIRHLAQMSSAQNSFENDFVITNTQTALGGSSQSVVVQSTAPAPAQPTLQVPQPVASPNASTSETMPHRRRQRPTHSSPGASSISRTPRRQPTVQVPQPVASPNASTSETMPHRRRQRPTHSSPGASSISRTPRRQPTVQVPQPVASPNASTSETMPHRRRQRPTHSSPGTSSISRTPRRQPTVQVPQPVASLNASTSETMPHRRRQRPTHPSPGATSISGTPRRQILFVQEYKLHSNAQLVNL